MSSTTNHSKLLLIDGHSMAYRAFYALPAENFRTGSGEYTNAVYGFVSMLCNLVRDEQPTHIGVAFDVGKKTFRNDLFPEYKAQRPPTPEPFIGQVDVIRQVVEALAIPTISRENYEADDVIATLVTEAEKESMGSVICTGDRDSFQLVTEQTTVLYPKKGVSELTRFTPEAVKEKYGLTPQQYPDFAALRGDSSDNLPGIPGVGEKTATKWIVTYGSLDNLLDHSDEIKGKVGENLRSRKESVRLNRTLTQMIFDVKLDYGPADLNRNPMNRAEVWALFDQLGFGSNLRTRVFDVFDAKQTSDNNAGAPASGLSASRDPSTSSEASSVADSSTNAALTTGIVLNTGEVTAWLTTHGHNAERYGVSVLGNGIPFGGDCTAISIAAPDGTGVFIGLEVIDVADDTALRDWLADSSVSKAIYDVKAAAHALAGRGLDINGVTIDVAIASYLVLPGQRANSLADLVERHLHRELIVDETHGGDGSGQLSLDLDSVGIDDVTIDRCLVEAQAVTNLATALEGALESIDGMDLLTELELPLARILAQMESVGIAVDRDYLTELERGFRDRAEKYSRNAYAANDGEELNLGSPKQLQSVLFDKLDLPKTKKTKTGYTTSAAALEELAAEHPHPFLNAVLGFREVTKLKTTVTGLLKTIADDGRIHTTFQQTVTSTGRLSSTDPNLQNIPVRTKDGRQIRNGFVVGHSYDGLLTADYSQIELRIMAHLSGDEELISAFDSGEDLHSYVGSKAFGVPIDKVTPELRRRTKAMSYGLAYGLSAYGLSQQLGVSTSEAKELMNAYFSRFGGIRDFLHAVVEQARHDGYTETMFGRRRFLPDLTSTNRLRRENAERAALNAPIQGSAADIVKIAMLHVDKALRESTLESRVLLQVHDELVVEVPPGQREETAALVVEGMDKAVDLRVPLEVSVGYGRTWDEAAH